MSEADTSPDNPTVDVRITDRTKRTHELATLDEYAQERISSKRDEIVDDPWRDQSAFHRQRLW